MKKSFFSLSILSLAILVSSSYSASAVSYAAPVKIFLNDTFLKTDVEPIIVNGRTLVPIRTLSEALNLPIHYDNATKTAFIQKDGKTIELPLGYNVAVVNGIINAIPLIEDVGSSYINSNTTLV